MASNAAQSQQPDMARFGGGAFVMGTDPSAVDNLAVKFQVKRRELFSPELPSRTVSLKPFALDRTEVTNAAFRAFTASHMQWAAEGGEAEPGDADLPVVYITRPAAMAFCQALGKRLPREAEWEFAASNAGTTEFPWGNEMPDATRANWLGAGFGKPVRVGSFPPTRDGVSDLAGNVWEFVQDDWPGSIDRGVIRGGSFGGSAINLRARFRDSHPTSGAGPHVGFRCAR
jgi:formylglycine-generating enzyme required for sulfatase activity